MNFASYFALKLPCHAQQVCVSPARPGLLCLARLRPVATLLGSAPAPAPCRLAACRSVLDWVMNVPGGRRVCGVAVLFASSCRAAFVTVCVEPGTCLGRIQGLRARTPYSVLRAPRRTPNSDGFPCHLLWLMPCIGRMNTPHCARSVCVCVRALPFGEAPVFARCTITCFFGRRFQLRR